MKKMILIAAASLCLSTVAVHAQVTPKSDTTIHQNSERDMVKITASELPDGLKTSLQDAKYKGWENAMLYKTKDGNGYVVEMSDATSNTPKRYKFDAMGRPMKD
jgi:hypothetical protein